MRLRFIDIRSLVLVVAALALPLAASAQQTRPNIFFDCDGRNCNNNYYRTEIGWVNWVNDREVADVHVIMTSEGTGAGGRQYRIDLIALGQAEDYEDSHVLQTLSTDTEREELDAIAHTLGLAVATWANENGFRGIVSLLGAETGGQQRLVSQQEVDDPWNLWTFNLNGSLNVDGESTRQNRRVNGSFNASRVSPTWKMSFRSNLNYSRVSVDLEDDETFRDTRTDWGFNPLIVYSVAEHWSVGFQGQAGRMTRFNQDFRAEFTPAIEFSVFPYEEATRRSFTFFYKIGPAYRKYIEQTIYLQSAETRFEQEMQIEFSQRQPWGDASVSITGSNYLHDFQRNRLSMRGDVEFRVVRGFSVNAEANVAWADDQIYLPLDEATDEEALLRLQQRASSFDYGFQVGFSIRFGSIFNNVVNNRFSGAGFGGFGGGGGGGGGRGGF